MKRWIYCWCDIVFWFTERCISQISEPSISENDNKPFILLEEHKSIVPVFDLNRRLGNVFAQFRYRRFVEKEFTVKRFLNGAIQVQQLIIYFRKNWFENKIFFSKVVFLIKKLSERKNQVQSMTSISNFRSLQVIVE